MYFNRRCMVKIGSLYSITLLGDTCLHNHWCYYPDQIVGLIETVCSAACGQALHHIHLESMITLTYALLVRLI